MTADKDFFVHPAALVETDRIGSGTRVWAFSHVMEDVTIGRNCNIGEHCFLESGVTVGDNCIIKNGVNIWNGMELEDSVFVGPNAVFTNDIRPRSKVFREIARTRIRCGASIGANATVLCGLEIGRFALVGAGTVVTRSVGDHALVVGNPGRLRGYVCRCGSSLKFDRRGHRHCACGLYYEKAGDIVAEAARAERAATAASEP